MFRRLALAQGVLLAPPQRAAAPVEGGLIAVHQSAPLRYLVHDMLLYSNNMMAELIGLSAAARLGAVPDLAAASALLLRHLERADAARSTGAGAELANHSGLDGERPADGAPARRDRSATAGAARRCRRCCRRAAGRARSPTASPSRTRRCGCGPRPASVNYGNALAGFLFPPTDRPAVFVAMISDLAARAAYDALPRPSAPTRPRAGLDRPRAGVQAG